MRFRHFRWIRSSVRLQATRIDMAQSYTPRTFPNIKKIIGTIDVLLRAEDKVHKLMNYEADLKWMLQKYPDAADTFQPLAQGLADLIAMYMQISVAEAQRD